MAIFQEGLQRIQEDTLLTGNQINTPPAGDSGIMDSPGLEGSVQQLLADNLGHYVQIDFLVGVQTLVRRSGIIYAVGRSFVVLYDETNRNFVMCDVFSAKFVAFFATRPAPGVLPNNPMGILQVDAQGNLWPVESMEPAPLGAGAAPGGQSSAAQQLVQAQQQALRAAQRLAREEQRLPGVASPAVVPPPETEAGPGWITLTDQGLANSPAMRNGAPRT